MRDPDPRGIIGEAYRMPELGPAECRSIFLDWVIGHRDPQELTSDIRTLLARNATGARDHPMTAILRAALASPPPVGRRGGWRSRRDS